MTHSERLFQRACELIPGGVNSPVRAWNAVGSTPFFTAKAQGSRMIDEDGRKYLDYVSSWGPLILGHAHPNVIQAVNDAAAKGTSFGTPVKDEVTLSEMIVQAVPSIEMVRLVNSGTEATLSAIRVARAHTARSKIVKTIGGYHGHHDALLASAGSGVATLAIPSTPGVPESVVGDTILVPYNDSKAVQTAFENHCDDIAAVILEPVAGNMGVVPPKENYLQTLRQLTKDHNALLIFDEVMTGFRVAYGGAQQRYGVTPDLTTLGKIIGGGMPIGAYGGKREIMQRMAPEGGVYQAGTLSGNPIATACGVATLKEIQKPGFYDSLEQKTHTLINGIRQAAQNAGIPVQINAVGSMMTVFFSENDVVDFASAAASNTQRFARFWQSMLEQGIYLPPSAFEAWFPSAAHSEKDIQQTIQAAQQALAGL